MQINLSWNDPFNGLTALALLTLLVVQIWLIVRNKSLTVGRRWLRLGLNVLLWLVITLYFLRPSWQTERPATHALLVGDEVPGAFVRRVKDSLRTRDDFTSRTFKADYDSVTLVGQDFPVETLTRLSRSTVRWVPYDQPDRVQTIRWKGLVRQGEMQRITGRIHSSKPQRLAVRYGRQTLDSVALRQGDNAFTLQFPSFARGRTQTELVLNNATTLDTLRFFTRAPKPMAVQFLLNNPDFESKALADWLGRQGHTVTVSARLSKNIGSDVTINPVRQASAKRPDLIITEPANAASAAVRHAAAGGQSVLFINLTNPPADVTLVNRALGSRWQVRRTSNQETVPVRSGLTALPYQFANAPNQLAVPGFPVAIQRTAERQGTGRVGVSLLNETFPLALSGDSVTYGQIWTAVLARLQPADQNNVLIDAPLFRNRDGTVTVNKPPIQLPALRIGPDTVTLTIAPLNAQSATGAVRLSQAGWQPVADSLAIYVANPTGSTVAQRRLVGQFVEAHTTGPSTESNLAPRHVTVRVPNWLWLTLLVVCLTALWVEPKANWGW